MSGQLAMSVAEVAEALDVSTDLIYQAVKRDEIPAVRVARRILIPRRWLEDLFNDSTAAVADVSPTPLGAASASGTAGSSTALTTPRPADNQAQLLAGGTPGEPAAHSKTG